VTVRIECRLCHEPADPERVVVHPYGWSMLCVGHWAELLNDFGDKYREDVFVALRVSHRFGIADDRVQTVPGEEPRVMYVSRREGWPPERMAEEPDPPVRGL
jgi:hypothetical protein